LAYRFLHNNLIELDDIGLFKKLAVETLIVTLHGVVGSVDRLNANSILLADVPRIEDQYPLLVDEINSAKTSPKSQVPPQESGHYRHVQ
jgi:hypothetical protein